MEWPKLDTNEQARAQGRVARWFLRREHRESGGKTLTLGELGSLIKRAHAEAEDAEPGLARTTILLRVEDMEREFFWRTFLGEDETDWPDDPAWTWQ